eukprot:6878388-Pyramimonas_sp.AAC.1
MPYGPPLFVLLLCYLLRPIPRDLVPLVPLLRQFLRPRRVCRGGSRRTDPPPSRANALLPSAAARHGARHKSSDTETERNDRPGYGSFQEFAKA